MSDIAPVASGENSARQATWEAVTAEVDRLPVPGGWMNRSRGRVRTGQGRRHLSHGHRRGWVASPASAGWLGCFLRHEPATGGRCKEVPRLSLGCSRG